MRPQTVIDAIEAGATTNQEIADAVERDHRHVGRVLKEMAEDDEVPIERERAGRSFEYSVVDDGGANAVETDDAAPASPSIDATEGEEDDSVMVANRNYDWDEFVPSDIPEYIPNNGEWEEANAMVDARDVMGGTHLVLGGPTGCGKTHFARRLADERDFPLFTIQGKYSLNEPKLLGSPSISPGGTTVWADGTLTKAVMASAERPVVLLLDEVNRARPEAKSVLFSALDDRCQVVLDGERGGEVVQGKAENLIVVSTLNEGKEHFVQEMDLAEKRRLGPKYTLKYLGQNDADAEAELVADRTPAGEQLGKLLVKAANEVRSLADDGSLKKGIPTGTLLDWARQAVALDRAGLDDPVVRAGKSVVLESFYGGSKSRSKVQQVIQNNLKGAPVEDDAVVEWADTEQTVYDCPGCGLTVINDGNGDLPEELTWGECPDCGHQPVDQTTRTTQTVDN